jgi:hypothetical protein
MKEEGGRMKDINLEVSDPRFQIGDFGSEI